MIGRNCAMNLSNWAGNFQYHAERLLRPASVVELRELIAGVGKFRAIGTRHSFSDIADTSGDLISLELLHRIEAPNRTAGTVTVEAGARYGELCRDLHKRGFALRNLASLPHISVAGACAASTHGSGDRNGGLATSVSAMEIVTAHGDVRTLSRESVGDEFDGMVVHLGALGVVTKLTLDIVPAFEMRQTVYENLPLASLEDRFNEIMSSAYSVSLFTNWRDTSITQAWLKCRVGDADRFDLTTLGATKAKTHLHPIDGLSAECCTEQMGIVGPWHERLPHFRMDLTPSSGEELQSEYFVPREEAVAAIRAISSLQTQLAPLLQVSEIRTIAADELWMSPCYKRASVAIHFTWKKDWPSVSRLLPLIERHLAPFQARPHWGKLFTMTPARIQSLYSRIADFRQLLCDYDPEGKFRNAFLERYIMSAAKP